MTEPATGIRRARQDETRQTIACIVVAFVADPLTRFAWPSPHQYLEGMPRVAAVVGGASIEHGAAIVSADFCGAGLWLPPGVHSSGEALENAFRETASPDHLDDLLATLEAMARWHPEEDHWYLPVLGVEANAQGRGLGAALMRYATARADADGALSYLESSNPRNIPLYERHGFEVMGEVQIGAGPLITPMLRRPRST